MIGHERIIYKYTFLICLYTAFLSVMRIVILSLLYATRESFVTKVVLQKLSLSFYLLTFLELLVYIVMTIYAYLTLIQLKKGQMIQNKFYLFIICYAVFYIGVTSLLGISMIRFMTPVFLATCCVLSLLALRRITEIK